VRVGIVGTRDYSSYEEVARIVLAIANRYPGAQIVSGGCRGVDSWAVAAAHRLRLGTVEFKVVQVKAERPRAGQFFISHQFQLADGGAGINPMVNNRTGEGFFRTFGKAAAHRNRMIASRVDVLVAVWDGVSSGAGMTVGFAHEAGTLVCVRRDGEWLS
jgi:predicted Rossmann fold nucleotide-binding protein DprA/Smf involved in DNA uptake